MASYTGFDGTAELWMPSTDLPVGHPFGLASSPDGSTLYVSCVGNGSNGRVVAIDIASKAVTTIASGLQYVKHGIDVDASGNVYWVTGPNGSSGTATLHKWDGSSVSTVWTDLSMFGMCIDGTTAYFEYRDGSHSDLRSRDLAGTTNWTVAPSGPDPNFRQYRGVDTTSQYVIAADSDDALTSVHNISTGAAVRNVTGTLGAMIGVQTYADDEVYLLSQPGYVYRYDPTTDTLASVTTSGLPVASVGGLSDEGPYAGLHITSEGAAFITRGGWAAAGASIPPLDETHLSDVGIYAFNLPSRNNWHVGPHAVRVASETAAADNGEEAIARITEAGAFRRTEADIARIVER